MDNYVNPFKPDVTMLSVSDYSRWSNCPTLNPEEVDTIVLDVTDTSSNCDLTAENIDNWHKHSGHIGAKYHYMVRPDGYIVTLRPFMCVGAACKDKKYNRRSISIVLVGGRDRFGQCKDTRTYSQRISLAYLMRELIIQRYPLINKIVGRRDVDSGFAQPYFDVKFEYRNFTTNIKSF